MRNYQLVLVLKASLSDIQRKKLLETIKSYIKDVKISKEEEWGQKPLSYSIKREKSGFYLNYQLEAKDAFPLDFEKKLMAQDDVLRHLLLRTN
jgi:ribosomal protein S6